jgi:hypothetical protein
MQQNMEAKETPHVVKGFTVDGHVFDVEVFESGEMK